MFNGYTNIHLFSKIQKYFIQLHNWFLEKQNSFSYACAHNDILYNKLTQCDFIVLYIYVLLEYTLIIFTFSLEVIKEVHENISNEFLKIILLCRYESRIQCELRSSSGVAH